MKQLTQQLKSGKMEILEVPFPALNRGEILVRNHYSVISSGTEGKTVSDARKGYIAKAKSRQKEVKQVVEMIKREGLLTTYNLVMNKLEAPSPLGYSCAGEVIAAGEGVNEFRAGDFVACGGNGAKHADVVSIPVKLAVKVPESVDLKEASFTTIGAIAIQGIRQADLTLGESCLIIGMGLIGQLTYKILEASGMKPIGVDISEAQVESAKKAGIKEVYGRNMPGIEEKILSFSDGHGVDAILITAGTSSLDPVEFAGEMARHKGKVVIVGAVPTGFSRENYYKKELELKMSMSYGPGRKDPDYEELGRDYPVGYVRWTENRNMQSFLHLLSSGRLDISPLISHTFPLEKAPDAYDMVLNDDENHAGIVIEYDKDADLKRSVHLNQRKFRQGEVNAGFIGAGSFAQNMLLPNLKGLCNFAGVASGSGTTSKHVAGKYAFNYCAENAEEILRDDEINTIFIATRHNLHAEYVIKALEAGKHVFVEKPLGMTEKELNEIKEVYDRCAELGNHLMVGFNRRFAPAVQKIMQLFDAGHPKSISIRVNAGKLPIDHWVNHPETGGGRIIGEACHFIDLAMYLSGGRIESVSADAMKDPNDLSNTIVIQLRMTNGSVASINYFSNGNKNVPKEFIEVFCGGRVAQIDDFKELIIFDDKRKKTKFRNQDKGHKNELAVFTDAIKNGEPTPIPFEESFLVSLATCKVLESIATGRKIRLD